MHIYINGLGEMQQFKAGKYAQAWAQQHYLGMAGAVHEQKSETYSHAQGGAGWAGPTPEIKRTKRQDTVEQIFWTFSS